MRQCQLEELVDFVALCNKAATDSAGELKVRYLSKFATPRRLSSLFQRHPNLLTDISPRITVFLHLSRATCVVGNPSNGERITTCYDQIVEDLLLLKPISC
jgi:hypothetical protein